MPIDLVCGRRHWGFCVLACNALIACWRLSLAQIFVDNCPKDNDKREQPKQIKEGFLLAGIVEQAKHQPAASFYEKGNSKEQEKSIPRCLP